MTEVVTLEELWEWVTQRRDVLGISDQDDWAQYRRKPLGRETRLVAEDRSPVPRGWHRAGCQILVRRGRSQIVHCNRDHRERRLIDLDEVVDAVVPQFG
jgi:hypothetical protein